MQQIREELEKALSSLSNEIELRKKRFNELMKIDADRIRFEHALEIREYNQLIAAHITITKQLEVIMGIVTATPAKPILP